MQSSGNQQAEMNMERDVEDFELEMSNVYSSPADPRMSLSYPADLRSQLGKQSSPSRQNKKSSTSMASAKEASRLNLRELGPQNPSGILSKPSLKATTPATSPLREQDYSNTPQQTVRIKSPTRQRSSGLSPNGALTQSIPLGASSPVAAGPTADMTPMSPPSPLDFIDGPFSEGEWIEKYSMRHKRKYWRNKITREVVFKSPYR